MTNEKIEQLVSDNKTIEIDDVEFEVNPLTTKQFLKTQVIGQNQDKGEAMLYMLDKSLENEDINKQGIRDSPAKFVMALQDVVEEVNDFGDFFDEDEKQEALEKLQ